MSEELGLLDFLDFQEEGTTNVTPPDVGRKRKLNDSEKSEPRSTEVTPSTHERRTFDYFAQLKSAKKKLKFGNEILIKDIQLGLSTDGILTFLVKWTNGLLHAKEGKQAFFKFIVADTTASVSCVAFGHLAETIAALIQPGNAYRLTGYNAKVPNEKYKSPGETMQLNIEEYSKIEPINDSRAPAIQFDFKSFAEMRELPDGAMADFLGIMVKDFGKRKPKQAMLRDIGFVDGENNSGVLTFFGDLAESFVFRDTEPAAISNVTIKAFMNQKSFDVFGNPIVMNPATGDLAAAMKREFEAAVQAIANMDID